MDDSFAFHGPRVPRRLDPWAVRLGTAGIVAVLVAGTFVGWAVASERTSMRRLEAANVLAAKQAAAQEQAIVSAAPGVPTAAAQSAAAITAQDQAFAALRAAKALHHRTGTFAAAGPAALTSVTDGSTASSSVTGDPSAAATGTLFVDGPSADPQIVSVAASDTAWAAAVMSTDGTCYYVKVAARSTVRYGTGTGCTGADAMSATGSAW